MKSNLERVLYVRKPGDRREQNKIRTKLNANKQYLQETRFYMAGTENIRKDEVKDGDVQVCNVGQ